MFPSPQDTTPTPEAAPAPEPQADHESILSRLRDLEEKVEEALKTALAALERT